MDQPLQQFFRSAPLPCPYLPGREERKLFTKLRGRFAAADNSLFTQAGFRRSHDIIYRPVCDGCDACVPVRIPVRRFQPSRSARRIRNRNADLVERELPAIARQEHFALFQEYQNNRHTLSDMARMRDSDFRAMIEDGATDTRLFVHHRDDGKLMGVMLADQLDDGFSAVYSFFDPAEPRRSLGHHMILSLVETAQSRGLDHVYLGYWVAGSDKMDYKARIRPLEKLTAQGWVDMGPEDEVPAS